MQISELQISQTNHQIQALIKAGSFYGKKLEEAGIDKVLAGAQEQLDAYLAG